MLGGVSAVSGDVVDKDFWDESVSRPFFVLAVRFFDGICHVRMRRRETYATKEGQVATALPTEVHQVFNRNSTKC